MIHGQNALYLNFLFQVSLVSYMLGLDMHTLKEN